MAHYFNENLYGFAIKKKVASEFPFFDDYEIELNFSLGIPRLLPWGRPVSFHILPPTLSSIILLVELLLLLERDVFLDQNFGTYKVCLRHLP